MSRISAATVIAVSAGLGLAACGKNEAPEQKAVVEQVKKEVAEAGREGAPRGLRAAVREQILESDRLQSQDWAMQMVYDFEHGVTYRSECSCGSAKDHDDQGDAYRWEFGEHWRQRTGDEHEVKVTALGRNRAADAIQQARAVGRDDLQHTVSL